MLLVSERTSRLPACYVICLLKNDESQCRMSQANGNNNDGVDDVIMIRVLLLITMLKIMITIKTLVYMSILFHMICGQLTLAMRTSKFYDDSDYNDDDEYDYI